MTRNTPHTKKGFDLISLKTIWTQMYSWWTQTPAMPEPHQIITASNVIGQNPPHTHTQKQTDTRMKCGYSMHRLWSPVCSDDTWWKVISGWWSWNHHQESHIIRYTRTHAVLYRFTQELLSVVSAAVSLMNGFMWHWIKVVLWQQSINGHHEIHSIWSTFILMLCSAVLEFVFFVSETMV